MSKAPAFQLYAADFYMDTVGWSCEEVGLYFRLLMAEWVNGPLPDDPSRLAKICQMSSKRFDHNFKNVYPKFVQNGEGYLVNVRLEETREKQAKYSESRAKVAHKRWDKDDAHALHTDMHTPCPSSSSSSSTSKTTTKDKKHIVSVPKNGTPPTGVKEFIDYAFKTFQNTYNEKMMIDGGKDGDIIKRLLKTYGLDSLKGYWDAFMDSDDPFICQAGRSIGVFKTQINKLVSAHQQRNPIVSKSSEGILSWAQRERERLQNTGGHNDDR